MSAIDRAQEDHLPNKTLHIDAQSQVSGEQYNHNDIDNNSSGDVANTHGFIQKVVFPVANLNAIQGNRSIYFFTNADQTLVNTPDGQLLTRFVQQDTQNSINGDPNISLLSTHENSEDSTNIETSSLVQLSTQSFNDETSAEKTDKKNSKEGNGIVFLCDFPDCGRYFSTKGYLKNHQNAKHGKRQNLLCEFQGCNRTFAWSAHLKYHRMTHLDERHYVCQDETCKKRFYTAQRLRVHMRSHTGEKPFKCTEQGCEKSFSTKGNLKNHRRIHTGEKPFLCNHGDCKQAFAEQSSLKKHLKTHTGVKSYECSVCQKTFTQVGSRNVHMRRHQLQPMEDDAIQSAPVVIVGTHDSEDESANSLEKMVAGVNKWNVIVQRHDDDLIPYNGDTGHQSIVYSSAIADHIVTVKTEQPPSRDNIVLAQATVVSEDSQTIDEFESPVMSEAIIGDNVVVLSQPDSDMTPRSYEEDHNDLNDDNDSLIH